MGIESLGLGDQIRAGACVTAHSTFRLSPETKALIRSLAKFFDMSMTDTVTKLAREEGERRGLLPSVAATGRGSRAEANPHKEGGSK